MGVHVVARAGRWMSRRGISGMGLGGLMREREGARLGLML